MNDSLSLWPSAGYLQLSPSATVWLCIGPAVPESNVDSHGAEGGRRGALIMFADETGFNSRDAVASTWGAVGKTPVLRRQDKRRGLSFGVRGRE